LNLADAILIKDNHLIAFQRQQGLEDPEQIIREVVLRALAAPGACFELEVEGRRQAMAALSTFEQERAKNASATQPAMILMLDNFKPPDAGALVEQIRAMAVYERVLLEASGDITEATLPQWAATGVDVVSLGALTHSTRSFNLSLEFH
jgi:nicotinate-nucleotide pyrophosphorylase (carboxylating)